MEHVNFFLIFESANWTWEKVKKESQSDPAMIPSGDSNDLLNYIRRYYDKDTDVTVFAVLQDGRVREVEFEYVLTIKGLKL